MGRSLANEVVVITGASSGIGRATALELAREGARLVLAARRTSALELLARECEGLGAQALVVPTDVTDADAVARLARAAIEHFGWIDTWVNNAGVHATGDFENMPEEVFRRVMETNFEGVVNGARAVLPHFRTRRRGVLVNVSSLYGAVTGPYLTAYCASKHAVRGFSASLRQELARTGVRVSTVLPAVVDTPIWEHAANYSGWGIRPVLPIYRPERIARRVVAAIRSPGRELYAGSAAPVYAAFRALLPRAFEPLMRATNERLQFRRRPAFDTPGNLFAPMEQGTEVSGGYRPRSWNWLPRVVAAIGLLGAGAAVALRARPAPRRFGLLRG